MKPLNRFVRRFVLVATFAGWTAALGGSWSEGPPIPTPRLGAVAGVLDGKLYVAGGATAGDFPFVVPTLEVYDPEAGTWTEGPPMLLGRISAFGAALDGKLYVIGGYARNRYAPRSVEQYDPGTETWTERAQIPESIPIAGHCVAEAAGAMLYVICRDAIFAYEPISDQWTKIRSQWNDTGTSFDPFPTRVQFAAGEFQGKLYLAGGRNVGPTADAVGELDVYDTLADAWTPLSPMPTPRFFATAGVLDGKLLVAGGLNDPDGVALGTLEEYDALTDTWATRPDMPTPRARAASGVVDGKLFVVGGFRNDPGEPDPAPAVSVVEVYAPEDDDPGEDKVCICHFPSGDLDKARTICVDAAAADAHVKEHGDTFGECGLRVERFEFQPLGENGSPRRSGAARLPGRQAMASSQPELRERLGGLRDVAARPREAVEKPAEDEALLALLGGEPAVLRMLPGERDLADRLDLRGEDGDDLDVLARRASSRRSSPRPA